MSLKTIIKKSSAIHQKYHRRTVPINKIINRNNFTYRLLIDVIDPFIDKSRSLDVLDVGCGAGALSLYIASKGNNVLGIDISKEAIKSCKRSAKHLKMDNTSFLVSAFPENFESNRKFELIILTEVIEHIHNDEAAIKKIYKLLKPDGTLILSTPSATAPLTRLGLTRKFDEEVGHIRRYSKADLTNILKLNNFEVKKILNIEGVLRNTLFVIPVAGKLVRYINFAGSNAVTLLDNITLRLFGASNYIVIASKSKSKRRKK